MSALQVGMLLLFQTASSTVLSDLLSVLRGVLHEDARLVKGAAAMRTLRCYAIKSSINGLLDVARKIYSEIIDDIVGKCNYEPQYTVLYLPHIS